MRQLHVFQSQMYAKSTHAKAFQNRGLPDCVVCHSNHGTYKPSDAMLGTGAGGVCMRCHATGDHCDRARANILSDLNRLDTAVNEAESSLRLAESAGMKVSEARLNQAQARDALTKARVTIHSFQTDLVEKDIREGMKIAAADRKAGEDAMDERNYRRIGLGVCLIAIVFMLVGLWLYIKQIES